MENKGAAKLLEEIGVLLELKGENPFKSRAYYSAARTIDTIGESELERLVKEDELKNVKGIGSAINEKLTEYIQTGRLAYYEDLKKSIPQGLLEMLKVPGLGPRKAKTLHDMLEITNLAELEYACRENRLISLKGFGKKTQNNILEGIEFIRHYQGQHFYMEAKSIADRLIERISDFPELGEVSLAGSIRRCMEIVKDIDIVASGKEPVKIIDSFGALEEVADVVARGETKISTRLKSGISVDLRVVKEEEFPYALHHFTGSKEHNTAMRHRAKQMGIKINEYGLFKTGSEERIDCRDEKDFFQSLGLSYIPPELRENLGEIEAAEKGRLPNLVEDKDIRGIFHVHTNYSDGLNTLEELVRYCSDQGYKYLGISDHSQSAFYAGGLKEDDLRKQREEIEKLQEKYPGIRIYAGVESDIRADGSLDYPDAVLKKLDFVIASVHSGLKMEQGKMMERLKKAISHPAVTMLGHPTNRLLLGRDGSHVDLEELFRAAAEKGVILELNANPARLDLDWRYLKKAKEMGLKISINPDAHQLEGFSDTYFGVAIARKGWLEKKDIFNALERDEVESYLNSRNG